MLTLIKYFIMYKYTKGISCYKLDDLILLMCHCFQSDLQALCYLFRNNFTMHCFDLNHFPQFYSLLQKKVRYIWKYILYPCSNECCMIYQSFTNSLWILLLIITDWKFWWMCHQDTTFHSNLCNQIVHLNTRQ